MSTYLVAKPETFLPGPFQVILFFANHIIFNFFPLQCNATEMLPYH